MATQRYVLKVLNGIYSGSELPLEAGEYVFGSAVDSDINIEDPALQPHEGRISVSDQSVTLQLEQHERPVHVGGQPFAELAINIQPYVPVYLGDFCFVLGREGEPWPEMDLGRYEPEAENAESAETDVSTGEAEAPAADDGAEQSEGVDTQADVEREEVAASEEAKSFEADDALKTEEISLDDFEDLDTTKQDAESAGGKSKAAVAALLVVIVIVGVFAIVSMWQANHDAQKRKELQRISNEEVIREVIHQSGLKVEIRESEIPGGKPRLSGYIAEDKQRAAFIAELDQAEARYQSDVYVIEQMLQAGYSLLNAFSFRGVELSAGRRPGTLVAKGYIESLERWLKIKVVIERDIEGLLALVDEVDTPSIRLGKLEESILRAGLDQEVKLYLSPDGLILARTSLSFENEPKWKILEDAFKKSFGNEPRLVTLIDDNNWIKIVAINFSGPVPYIVLEDGRKYIEGSNLDNGYKLKEISPNGVILQGQFGERVMPLKLTN